MQDLSLAKSILVTGSNKGIGYGILKGLLQKTKDYKLILTSRDKELGGISLNELKTEFPEKKNSLYYHQLDITDKQSIKNCLEWVKKEFGQLDILVNNAAVAQKGSKFDTEVFDFTFGPNVFGTINLTESVIEQDLIRKNGKIIMIGSIAGLISRLTKKELQNEFTSQELEVDKLLELSRRFRDAIEFNRIEQEGWPKSVYSVSKMTVNVYPRILAKRKEIIERNIGVYSCHPGWVKTDMAGPNAPLSLEEGVVTPIHVIELDDGIISERQGKYYDRCQIANLI